MFLTDIFISRILIVHGYVVKDHNLAGVLEVEETISSPIVPALEQISNQYNLGKFILVEEDIEHITFDLDRCNSCKDLTISKVKMPQGFCSFEAGLYAGLVEKMTGKHCFAQELECRLQGTVDYCRFMIVIPQE